MYLAFCNNNRARSDVWPQQKFVRRIVAQTAVPLKLDVCLVCLIADRDAALIRKQLPATTQPIFCTQLPHQTTSFPCLICRLGISRLKICCGHHTTYSRRSSRSIPSPHRTKPTKVDWMAIRWMARCWQIDFQILSYCKSYLCYSHNDCNCWRLDIGGRSASDGGGGHLSIGAGERMCAKAPCRQPASQPALTHSWLVDKVTCHIHWTDI